MMQCRMCSQRLTRPGKLCRECERELDRARHVGASIAELAATTPFDESHHRTAGWLERLRAPGPVVAAAFAVGLAGAVALHVVDAAQTGVASRSIMLDARPARSQLRQVSIGAAAVALQDDAQRDEPTPVPPARRATMARETRVVSLVSPAALRDDAHAPDVSKVALRAPAPSTAAEHPDSARALGVALARCADEAFFARPGCEQRARSRYCDASTMQLPQCTLPARDYGQ